MYQFLRSSAILTNRTAPYLVSSQSSAALGHSLFCFKAGTFRLAGTAGLSAPDADMLRNTAAALIINAVYRFTVYLQTVLRRLKKVCKGVPLVLVKAGATGITLVSRCLSFYHNRIFAAAVVCIMNATGYITI